MSYIEIPFTVEPNYAGWRLDRYLTAKLRRFSRARVQRIIEHSLVGDRPLKCSSRVHAGMAFFIRRAAQEEPETPTYVPIVHEDAAIVVVDKPAGLPIHPTARYHHGTLVGRLRERYGHGLAEPVHRLDRETSGLVICARTVEASRYFMRAFQSSNVHKEYLAIVEGWPEPEHNCFTVDAPIAAGGELVRIAVRIDACGRPSRTHFEVEQRFRRGDERFALVRANPETGRQHQIRVHLRHAGYPIVGDKMYGQSEAIYDRFVTHALTDTDYAALRLDRHALHAHRLEFMHPNTGERVRFEAPLPNDMRQFLTKT